MSASERPIVKSGGRVALMQPTFLPWQGYFALIAEADVFVFLDDYQFSRQSFHHRNRLFIDLERVGWVTMPIGHRGKAAPAPINAVQPVLDRRYRKKFLGTLFHAYGHSSHYDDLIPEVEAWITAAWSDLASLDIAFIELAAALLQIETVFLRSSSLPTEGTRSTRLVSLLQAVGAAEYLSPRGSYEYLLEDGVFPRPDLRVAFQRFEPAPYPQAQSEQFVSHLSVLDALFQVGPGETRQVIARGQSGFDPWASME